MFLTIKKERYTFEGVYMISKYSMAFTLGIFIVFLISILVSKMSKKNSKLKEIFTEKENYDERQIASRLLAYKYSFIALTICLFTLFFFFSLSLNYIGYIPEFFSPLITVGVIIFIGATTFSTTAIWNNAFLSFKNKAKNTKIFNIIFFLSLGLIALINGILRANTGIAWEPR